MVSERSRSTGRAVIGLYLILIGGLIIAENLGFDIRRGVWNYWPLLIIGMGGAKIAFSAGDRETIGSGIWILLGGIYCWVSVWNLWGLTWHTAWPIFLVAGGLGMIVEPRRGRRRRCDGRAAETAEGDSHVS